MNINFLIFRCNTWWKCWKKIVIFVCYSIIITPHKTYIKLTISLIGTTVIFGHQTWMTPEVYRRPFEDSVMTEKFQKMVLVVGERGEIVKAKGIPYGSVVSILNDHLGTRKLSVEWVRRMSRTDCKLKWLVWSGSTTIRTYNCAVSQSST